jgi:hypothetical protein
MDLTINLEDYLETNKINITPIMFQKMKLHTVFQLTL